MTEQANRAGRITEWIVVGTFSCLLVILLAQVLSWFVTDGVLVIVLAFLASPSAILIAVVAVTTWLVLMLIKRFS